MLQTLCDHSKGEDLCPGHRLFTGRAISQYPGQLRDFRNPAAIFFLLGLDREIHSDTRSRRET